MTGRVALLSFLAALMLAGSPSGAPPARAEAGATPIIISTDTATGLENGWRAGVSDIDDGLAVAMALASVKLDVRGVVVTFGNNLMEPEYAIAARVVAGMGSTVPVRRGAPRPLPEVAVKLYDGTAIVDACLNDGVRFMAEELKRSSAPVSIAAIGPLTDVACLVQNFPDAAQKIEDVVVIGGRDPGQAFAINGHYVSDFNLALDVPAITYLLDETAIPLRFMPFGLTSSVLVPAADRAALCASPLKLASDFLCSASVPWIEQWRRIFGEDGFHPWDQNAIQALADPRTYDCDPARYEIVDCAKAACAGHDPKDPTRLASETAQLWLSPDPDATRVRMCRSYAPGGRAAFRDAIFAFAEGGG
jgi:inosine-uridine nucleoside N-ribohydrolase